MILIKNLKVSKLLIGLTRVSSLLLTNTLFYQEITEKNIIKNIMRPLRPLRPLNLKSLYKNIFLF